MAAALLPDRDQLAAFVDAIFMHCDPEGRIAYKAFDGSDKPVFTTSTLKLSHPTVRDAAYNYAKMAATIGRTAVFCPPLCTFRDTTAELGRQSTAADAVHEGPVLSVDADSRPDDAWAALVAVLGEPTLIVLSGGEWVDGETGEVQDKVHLHWRLTVPARGPEALSELHEARWLACKIAGGDGTGAPVVHPLRWPGSIHNKSRARLATIAQQTENELSLIGALAALRAAWTGSGYHEAGSYESSATGPRTASDEDVAAALSVIPNADLPWDEWKRIGLAVWAATSGGGFALFDAWSRGSSKYTAKGTTSAWKKIDRSPPSSLGVGSLFFLANEHDPSWSKPSEQVLEADADFVELRATPQAGVAAVVLDPADDSDFAELRPRAAVVLATPTSIEAVTAKRGLLSTKLDTTLPDHLTRVPGLLGATVEWILATDRRPNRALSLGAAVTILGTLIGQRVAGPTMSGTHLYVIGLAASGAGKDHALHQISRLLEAANAAQLSGPSEFMSQTALVGFLFRQPLSCCAMDELGAFLKRLSHKRASPHEQGVTKILRTAWGTNFEKMRTPEWGGRQFEEIQSPALSIYGVSTPEEFFASMQGSDVANGFLNRFLMIEAPRAPRAEGDVADRFTVPEDLRKALVRLHADAIRLEPGDNPLIERPKVLPWRGDAEAAFRALEADMELIRDDPTTGAFYARTAEMAVRLATIRAAGQNWLGVSREDMEWGRDLALWSARKMAEAAAEHMAANDFADYQNRIVRFMKKKHGPVTRRDIQTHIKGELKVRELDEVMAVLTESGRVAPIAPEKKPGPGRPPPVSYRLLRA